MVRKLIRVAALLAIPCCCCAADSLSLDDVTANPNGQYGKFRYDGTRSVESGYSFIGIKRIAQLQGGGTTSSPYDTPYGTSPAWYNDMPGIGGTLAVGYYDCSAELKTMNLNTWMYRYTSSGTLTSEFLPQ